jgi:hypothetical protein
MGTRPSGLLIIRAWVENGSTEPLRAQIRMTDDLAAGLHHSLTLVHSDRVAHVVEAWLRSVVDHAVPDADR